MAGWFYVAQHSIPASEQLARQVTHWWASWWPLGHGAGKHCGEERRSIG